MLGLLEDDIVEEPLVVWIKERTWKKKGLSLAFERKIDVKYFQ